MSNTNFELNKQPLLILVICFILGIFFQDKIMLGETYIYIAFGVCLLIFISTFFHAYFLYKIKPALLGMMFFGMGIMIHSYNILSTVPIQNFSNEKIVFKISKKLNSTEKYKKYESFIQVGKQQLNSIIFIPQDKDPLDFNHYYQVTAYISKVKPPQFDFQFDYAGYLKRKNIEYQSYVSGDIVGVMRNDLTIKEKVSQKRLDVLQKIDQSGISSESKAFLKGIILADRTELSSVVVQDFNRSGLVHLLAISGTHIMVIFGLFYFLLKASLPLRFRKYVVIISLLFIWLFAGFIGFGNSVLRACTMLTVYFIYVLLQRKTDVLHSMALAAFIILIIDTQELFNLGFQLSFMAVLGIFWLNKPILKLFPKQDHYLKKLIFNTVSISISAQLATLPLILYYFHQYSLISILANFIVVPFSELIIVFSFIMAILIALNLDFNILNIGYDFVIRGLLKCIHWFAELEILFFENISMNLLEAFVLLAIIYWLRFVILKFNFKNSMVLIMGILVFFIVRSVFNVIENQEEEVLVHHVGYEKVFSVKEGDKVCFWMKNSIDQDKVYKYVINPYCSSRRLKYIQLENFPELTKKIMYKGKIYDIN